VLTLVSFSRDKILGNIPFSRGLSTRSEPPIRVLRGKVRVGWTYGLELSGPAEVLYRVDRSPSAWLETNGRVTRRGRNGTCDHPGWRRECTYVYVQLSRIARNKKRFREGFPVLPPLTARSRCSRGGKWRSRCSKRIRIKGPSTIRYSLGRPLPGTGKGDTGVRLWIETRSRVEPGPGGWSRFRRQ